MSLEGKFYSKIQKLVLYHFVDWSSKAFFENCLLIFQKVQNMMGDFQWHDLEILHHFGFQKNILGTWWSKMLELSRPTKGYKPHSEKIKIDIQWIFIIFEFINLKPKLDIERFRANGLNRQLKNKWLLEFFLTKNSQNIVLVAI